MSSFDKIYFTPGPTQVHPVAKEALRSALDLGIGSISHRSKEYEKIHAGCVENLRKLFGLPSDYEVFFLSSGTEAWERVLQNTVTEKSLHLINGSFSKRFYETAQELDKVPQKIESPLGTGFSLEMLPSTFDAETLCCTLNETSTGVCLPKNFLEDLRKRFPKTLCAVDAVSCAPYPQIDMSAVDTYFFSVQKFFGLPAGLAVLFVSPRALEKSAELRTSGKSIGAHHSFASLRAFSVKHQTPTTPNVISIYALSKVVEEFNRKGIQGLCSETELKARALYEVLESSSTLVPFVAESRFRSQTVITVEVQGRAVAAVTEALASKGLVLGQGYGPLKDRQFRIANFGSHSVESVQKLVDALKDF